jgi:hypothetical protein
LCTSNTPSRCVTSRAFLERLAWIEHLAAFDDEVELVSRPHGGVRPNNPAAAAKLVRQANDGDRHRLIIAYSQRHQACRSAGRPADQVRTSDQHEEAHGLTVPPSLLVRADEVIE